MISKENLILIRDFIDAGNKFVVASGRNYNQVQKLIKIIDRPVTFIGCNSSIIYENNKLIYEKPFDEGVIFELIKSIESRFDPSNYVLMSKDENCMIYARKYKASFKLLYNFWANAQGAYKERYRIVKKNSFDNEIKNGKIYKVMVIFGLGYTNVMRASLIAKYLAKYHDLTINWSGISIEITPKGCTKSSGIAKYLELHNLKNTDEVYVVGDSGNDICMFKDYYEHSFCMEHSNSNVKKYAKNIINNFSDLRKYIL